MSRFAFVPIVLLLLASSGYLWYEKSTVESGFEARESELLQARTLLEDSLADLRGQGDSLRTEIEGLKRRLARTRLSVGELPRKPGLEQTLRRSYPELAETDWGVIEVYDDRSRRYVDYMVVPLWMSETFILDHQNASRCIARR